MKIEYCKKCVNPSTRPNIQFNEQGICPVCQFEEFKKEMIIDWDERRGELKEICHWGKQNTTSTYDCIVTVSGGKDSTRQACYARDELGMNPLLVSCTYPPEQLTERGADNLENLIELGFDTLSISLNPIMWKRLMRQGFFLNGNWARSTEMALYAIPIHAAIAYQIPLIFYGENPVLTIGEKHGNTNGDASRLKQGNTISGGPSSLLPKEATPQDTHFYYYPSDKDMELASLRLIYLGYYIEDWSGRNNAEFSIARGLKVRDETPEMTGDLWGFSCLDEDYSIVNQFLKYLKLGFGRVTDQVCEAINAGIMGREEGFELIKKFDGKCDASFIQRFCHYLEIPEENFWEIAEQFRNQQLWKKDSRGNWQLI
jgi:N-acetyl sugar amidotransferase